MSKILNNVFLLGVMASLGACSQSKEEPQQPPASGETQTVSISMTRCVQDYCIASGV